MERKADALICPMAKQVDISIIVPVDSGAQEDQVWPKHSFHQGEWDGSCFIYNQELSLCQCCMMLRLDVLYCLHTSQKKQ